MLLTIKQIHFVNSNIHEISSLLNVSEEGKWISECFDGNELEYLMKMYEDNVSRVEWIFNNLNEKLLVALKRHFTSKEFQYHKMNMTFLEDFDEECRYEEMQMELSQLAEEVKHLETEISDLKKCFKKEKYSYTQEMISSSNDECNEICDKVHLCSSDGQFYFDWINDFACLYNVLVIGDYGAGKSCLCIRLCDNKFFDGNGYATLGFEHWCKSFSIDGSEIKLRIWEYTVYSKELFKFFIRKGCPGCIVFVYDVTDEKAFSGINAWVEEFPDCISSDVEKFLIGNKFDMEEKRRVSVERGNKFADLYNMSFMEASAKTGVNVEEIFRSIATNVKRKVDKTQQLRNLSQNNSWMKSLLKNNNRKIWNTNWRDVVNGKIISLDAILMMPERCDGVLIWISLEREKSDLLIKAKYYKQPWDPSAVTFIAYNILLKIRHNQNEVITTDISRKNQNAVITTSFTTLQRISSLKWRDFIPHISPVLTIQILKCC